MSIIKKYNRILLKLSGEVFAGKNGSGFDPHILATVAEEIYTVIQADVQVGIVIGGGNLFRGLPALQSKNALSVVSRTTADTVGMLATAMNCCIFSEYLISLGMKTHVFSAISMDRVADLYTPYKAINALENNRVVLIACGTGNPFFTTDTAAALRCAEIEADILIKATKVDGIYDSDPAKNPHAKKIDVLTHHFALESNIQVMDSTAFSLCRENAIPIIVFKLLETGNLLKCIQGMPVGSLVKKETF